MALDGLKALPVGRLADDDCTLFLWATHPKMREALEVIEAWGFRYVTCAFLWVKTNRSGEGFYSGLGYWTNGNTEPCLLAVKGHPRWMRAAKVVKQLVVTPVGRHSAKPDEVRDRIVRLMGDRHGWNCLPAGRARGGTLGDTTPSGPSYGWTQRSVGSPAAPRFRSGYSEK